MRGLLPEGVLLILLGCTGAFVACDSNGYIEEAGTGFFERVTINGDELFLRCRTGVELRDVVLLTQFADFDSAEPLWEIVERKPTPPVQAGRSRVLRSYEVDGGTIEILSILVGSEESKSEKWELRFRPSGQVPAHDVQPQLADFVDRLPNATGTITVFTDSPAGAFSMTVDRGKVVRLFYARPGRAQVRPEDARIEGVPAQGH